jgi:predicted PurR-regulated permease PerM
MAGLPGTERLRVTPRSAVRTVAMLGAALLAMRVVAASARVLGWMVAAALAAGLLHPFVRALSRVVPRAVAALAVAALTLGAIAFVGYGVVQAVARETRALERAAPEAARRLERSERWGDVARQFHLAARTRDLVDEIPQRLRGGTPAEALRAAATRGVAFLATGVLTLFFVLYGERLVASALAQIGDPARRARVEAVARAAYRRAARYALGSLGMAVAAGTYGYAVARAAEVRGAAALGLWVGLWDLVPVVGAFVGALPIALLALVFSVERAVVVAGAFLAYQLLEALTVQRWVERASVRVGPFLTVVAGVAGVEVYGLGGGVAAVALVVLAVAVADELRPA